jgi:CheY-like chemotaxis protein
MSVEHHTPAGDARVLVVDDESVVRMCVARVLESEGYTVLSASDGAQALEMLQREQIGVDLVLTDINMPGLDGLELGRRIAALGCSFPVLYMSAELPDTIFDVGAGHTIPPFLLKPFSFAMLVANVGRLLTERRAKRTAILNPEGEILI